MNDQLQGVPGCDMMKESNNTKLEPFGGHPVVDENHRGKVLQGVSEKLSPFSDQL